MALLDVARRLWSLGEPQQRTVEFGSSALPSWTQASGAVSSSGTLVTHDSAVAIATVAAAIRQPALLIAGLPLDVYDVADDRRNRTLASNKWQNQLLDQPDKTIPRFQFYLDLVTHLGGYANAVALKFRERGRVVDMALLDPSRMKVEMDGRRKRFYFQKPGGPQVEIQASDLIHFRAWDDAGRPWARSPIQRHRDSLGKTSARSEMEERYLANDGRPGVVIKLPGSPTREQVLEFLDLWNAQHRGQPGKVAVMSTSMEIDTLPVSFRDAQFVETAEFAVTDIARIFDWPADLLERQTERDISDVLTWATHIHLKPRLELIESVLTADPELFGTTSKFRPYFDPSEFLRGDYRTMAEVFHNLKQVGIMTANEARLPLGFPPIEGGDELQETPVGGAPNAGQPAPEPAPDNTEPAE